MATNYDSQLIASARQHLADTYIAGSVRLVQRLDTRAIIASLAQRLEEVTAERDVVTERATPFADLDAFLDGRKCLGTDCDGGHTHGIGCIEGSL